MNLNLYHNYGLSIKDLSVGSILQNVSFYALLVIMTNAIFFLFKIKQEERYANKKPFTGNASTKRSFPNVIRSEKELIKNNTALNAEVVTLKNELLALGEELELSYARTDRLNDQLADVLDCLDLTKDYGEDLWRWSLNFNSGEVSISDYGLRVHRLPQRNKLLLVDYLCSVEDKYHESIKAAIANSLEKGADVEIEYRLIPYYGSIGKLVKLKAQVIIGVDHLPLTLKGTFAFGKSEILA